MTFVVIVERGLEHDCYGPYRSFSRAEGDAKAWNGYVLPIEKPEAFKYPESDRSESPISGGAGQ